MNYVDAQGGQAGSVGRGWSQREGAVLQPPGRSHAAEAGGVDGATVQVGDGMPHDEWPDSGARAQRRIGNAMDGLWRPFILPCKTLNFLNIQITLKKQPSAATNRGTSLRAGV